MREKVLPANQPSTSQGALRRFASALCSSLQRTFAVEVNKWRLFLLVFIAAYACLLLYNLSYMAVQWDEMPHLLSGLLIGRGRTYEYLMTYGYYPPLYDILTTGYFQLFGATVTSGRLVTVTFSLLTVWGVFEFANQTYGPKIAFLSSVLLGVTPGFLWLSRTAMLDTMLIFFFSLVLFVFFVWLEKNQNKVLILSAVVLGVGLLAKYQVFVAVVVMLVAVLLLTRHKLKRRFAKFLIVPVIAFLIIVPWFYMIYEAKDMTRFEEVLYVINEGHEHRLEYSTRFPVPIFYLIELAWPFTDVPVHPVSLPLYILGLGGLVLWAYRRRTADKFFLLWFIITYVFFTVIPNRQWRYVTPLFPVLAISAASFIFFVYCKISAVWKQRQVNLNSQRNKQIAAALFIALAASTIVYSCYDAYVMTARDQIHIPIDEVANFAFSNMTQTESLVLLCPFNLFSQDMFRFYLPAGWSEYQVWQYPELPVDSFKPHFNITEFISLCEERKVKWVTFYEYGPHMPFFNTTLTMAEVTTMLSDSGRFAQLGGEPWQGFGTYPHRVFIFGFLPD